MYADTSPILSKYTFFLSIHSLAQVLYGTCSVLEDSYGGTGYSAPVHIHVTFRSLSGPFPFPFPFLRPLHFPFFLPVVVNHVFNAMGKLKRPIPSSGFIAQQL